MIQCVLKRFPRLNGEDERIADLLTVFALRRIADHSSLSHTDGTLSFLELHLNKENPVLVSAVQTYRQLDQVGRSLGLLDSEQSF